LDAHLHRMGLGNEWHQRRFGDVVQDVGQVPPPTPTPPPVRAQPHRHARCRSCNRFGHLARDCTRWLASHPAEPDTLARHPASPARGGGGGRACYNCGETGHISHDCRSGDDFHRAAVGGGGMPMNSDGGHAFAAQEPSQRSLRNGARVESNIRLAMESADVPRAVAMQALADSGNVVRVAIMALRAQQDAG